ncbi:MAG TPA: cobaltochelatase subunit CobN [Pyrinomonadaceae bacterium]|nr:cobaltochelatase subunit CobN [Pyrinomonadaceae bacterium]
MKIAVLYVGSSLLAPLKNAERELNREHNLDLRVAAWNFGAPLDDDEWATVEKDLADAGIVFVIHVMDGENAARLISALERYKQTHRAVIVINCMPDLMRRTRMGRLDVLKLIGSNGKGERAEGKGAGNREAQRAKGPEQNGERGKGKALLSAVGSWMGRQVRGRESKTKRRSHTPYLKLVDRLPGLLRFVPSAGGLRDVKHYLNIFCYFLQPTPGNIRSMLLYAVKAYVPDDGLKQIDVAPPEEIPSVAIYHPDAPRLFQSFDDYQSWYLTGPMSNVQCPMSGQRKLNPESTVGLLLMRPQVVSKTTKHYDALIRAIEAEGLNVIPALSTLMDNREASEKFFLESKVQGPKSKVGALVTGDGRPEDLTTSRVSQIVSLTGFSFVGGPAMNDSEAAAEFLTGLNRPYRSALSLDTQTVDAWLSSPTGLNPVQSGMQIAIPEIDGATEPFIYGGIPVQGVEPLPLEERCSRYARRLRRWNRLRTASRSELKLALVLFCFPPNKGNIGTAADLDVFPGVWDTLHSLAAEGYKVEIPASPDDLRERIIGGNSSHFGSTANVAYQMNTDEYRELCPYVNEVEDEWGAAPGKINSTANDLLIQGVQLGNVFVGVQPTFGYEGDPMRLMMARGGAPHHGFMAFYTYLARVVDVDAVVHVGTHGALEFMPGKQVGLSEQCWPDRLIGELPNIYLYSVNNPSEGSIAKRRSYAELISYLTPPIENAGLYKDLNTLKELVSSYRQSNNEHERERLFESIEAYADGLNLG